jgi:hypothetical protein
MIRNEYADHPEKVAMDLRDGMKVSFEKGWLHVRGSNSASRSCAANDFGLASRARVEY